MGTQQKLEKNEGGHIIVKFVRRQTKSRLMANKNSLKDYEEKLFTNDIITLLRARLANASRFRVDIKSVVMLNEKVVIYKFDEPEVTFENLFKLFEGDPEFYTLFARRAYIFVRDPLTHTQNVNNYSVNVRKFVKLFPLIMLKTNGFCT